MLRIIAFLALLAASLPRAGWAQSCNGVSVPSWTTSARPTTPPDSTVGFNSTVGYCEQYSAGLGIWLPLGTVAAQIAIVTLTKAQILAANATPVTIVPAPGTGRAIIVLFAIYEALFGTTPYTDGGGLYYGSVNFGGGIAVVADGGDGGVLAQNPPNIFVLGSNASFTASGPVGGATGYLSNQAVVYTSNGGLTGGDGGLRITVVYNTVPLN